MEYVQAHATYRFYVVDEEEEKPRLLVSPAAYSLLEEDPYTDHGDNACARRSGFSNQTFDYRTLPLPPIPSLNGEPSKLRKSSSRSWAQLPIHSISPRASPSLFFLITIH